MLPITRHSHNQLPNARGPARRYRPRIRIVLCPTVPSWQVFSPSFAERHQSIRAPDQHDTPSITRLFAFPDFSPPRETLTRTLTAIPTKRVSVVLCPIRNGPTAKSPPRPDARAPSSACSSASTPSHTAVSPCAQLQVQSSPRLHVSRRPRVSRLSGPV
jgi:hypothetical protein